MLFVVCASPECSTAVRVLCSPIDDVVGPCSEYWPESYICPRCGGKAAGFLETALARLPETAFLFNLEVEEMLRAQYGMGLPEEQDPSEELVACLLKGTPVRHVRGRTLKSGRFLLEELELWDGHKLYFGACPDGAIIYRVSKPYSHVQQVLKSNE